MPDQPDGSDLRERVADLEATVSDQQETIQQLMPSRRQAIAGAGLLGGGLLGGRLSTGTARAQAAGAQGTEDSPNDMFAWNLDVQNGVTSDLPMGGNDVTGVGELDVEERSIIDTGAEAADSTGTSVPNTTFTKVEFDSVIDDDNNHWDTTTSEFTVPRAGDYSITGHIRLILSTAARCIVEVVINTASYRLFDNESGAHDLVTPFAYVFKDLSVNDTIHIEVWQDSGDSVSLDMGRNSTSVSINQES